MVWAMKDGRMQWVSGPVDPDPRNFHVDTYCGADGSHGDAHADLYWAHGELPAPVSPPEPAPVSVKEALAGAAVALVADPSKITRRGFFFPWRRTDSSKGGR